MIFAALQASQSSDGRAWRSWTDEELVACSRSEAGAKQAQQALSELLRRYQPLVFRWCRGYTRDREAALDLAQDVLVNAYRGLPNFDGQSRFSSWLFAIARNRCLSAARRREWDREDAAVLEMLPSAGPAPDAAIERRQQQEALRRSMRGHLNEREEEAIWLRVIERMSVDQITMVLGLENATGARSLLQNARRKLRRALGGGPIQEDG